MCNSTSSDTIPPTSDQNPDKTSTQNPEKSKNLIKSPPSDTNDQSDKVDYSEPDSPEADLLRAVISSAR
jgi:hypothetical protein